MLYRPVGGERLEPRCYVDEIKAHKPLDFHIANRDRDITRILLETTHGKKANIAIIGEPGNGKSITLGYLLDVVTGKINLDEKHQWYSLFEDLKDMVRQFQAKDYIFLPNLQDPSRPLTLDFEPSQINSAVKGARKFSRDVSRLSGGLGTNTEVYPRATKEQYTAFVRGEVQRVYETLYLKLNEVTSSNADFDIKAIRNCSSFRFSYKFLDEPHWDNMCHNLGLNKTVKVSGKRKKVDPEMVERSLKGQLRNSIVHSMTELLNSPHEFKVDGWGSKDMVKVVEETLITVDAEYQKISKIHKEGIGPYFREIAKMNLEPKPGFRISPESVDWFCTRIKDIGNEIDAPDSIKAWMASVARYFDENREMTEQALRSVYTRTRLFHTAGRRVNPRKVWEMHPLSETQYGTFLEIDHGKGQFYLDDVLEPVPVYLSKGGELSIKYPKSFSDEEMWGTIRNPNLKSYTDNGHLPPHRCYSPGYLMQAGIIVLPDNMEGFFKALLGSEVKESAARRQQVLNLVEEQEIMVEQFGVSFNIHSPLMIIGCDNKLPFYRHHSEEKHLYEPDMAMGRRFVMYDWQDFTPNTQEARRGSIDVILQAVEGFNQKHHSNVSLEAEVINVLLTETISADLIQLNYRKVTDSVFELLGFGIAHKQKTVGLDALVALNLEKEKANRFKLVARNMENIISPPNAYNVGRVWAVAARKDGPGEVDTVKSGHILDLAKDSDRSFQLFDSEAELAGDDTVKGYQEAVGFVKGQLGIPVRYLMRTTFDRQYGVHGPSGSLTIATSLMSAISNTPVRGDTVMTGGVSFQDGTIGPMGSLYEKSLAIWRTSKFFKEKGMKGNMRFVFPVENYRELKQQLVTCPYPVEKEIDLIPVETFEEAFHLATTKSKVNLKKIRKNSQKSYAKAIKKARKNTTTWNKRVLQAYGGEPMPPNP